MEWCEPDIASLIETTHDANGIIWPVSLAPYEVLCPGQRG